MLSACGHLFERAELWWLLNSVSGQEAGWVGVGGLVEHTFERALEGFYAMLAHSLFRALPDSFICVPFTHGNTVGRPNSLHPVLKLGSNFLAFL